MSKEKGNWLARRGSLAAGDRGRSRLSCEAYLSWLVQDGHPSLLEIEKIRLENETENYCLGVIHKRAFHARGWKVSPQWQNRNGNSLLGNSWGYVTLWQRKTGHSSQQQAVIPVRGSRRQGKRFKKKLRKICSKEVSTRCLRAIYSERGRQGQGEWAEGNAPPPPMGLASEMEAKPQRTRHALSQPWLSVPQSYVPLVTSPPTIY